MKAAELHHASIRVADVTRARAFYEGLLGLQALARPDVGVPGRWYGIGTGQLHLIESSGMGGGIDPAGPHFALAVADLDAVRRELAAAGVETLDPGGNQLWIRDPDGNTVELIEPPGAAPPVTHSSQPD
jgi:catechol 2,3-dioxygenase-like lactoylglutathione lyase family enzyme